MEITGLYIITNLNTPFLNTDGTIQTFSTIREAKDTIGIYELQNVYIAQIILHIPNCGD
jgi:hypothetical protein